MNAAKALKTTLAVLLVIGFCAAPAMAAPQGGPEDTQPAAEAPADNDNQGTASEYNELKSLAGIGAGIVVLGAAIGIGLIGSGAVAGISRQPEASGDLRTTMIIAAALIEGVALFGLIICLIVGG